MGSGISAVAFADHPRAAQWILFGEGVSYRRSFPWAGALFHDQAVWEMPMAPGLRMSNPAPRKAGWRRFVVMATPRARELGRAGRISIVASAGVGQSLVLDWNARRFPLAWDAMLAALEERERHMMALTPPQVIGCMAAARFANLPLGPHSNAIARWAATVEPVQERLAGVVEQLFSAWFEGDSRAAYNYRRQTRLPSLEVDRALLDATFGDAWAACAASERPEAAMIRLLDQRSRDLWSDGPEAARSLSAPVFEGLLPIARWAEDRSSDLTAPPAPITLAELVQEWRAR